MITPATRLPAIVPPAVPSPAAVTSCFLACPKAASAMFVPVNFSDASAFAPIAPAAPNFAVTNGGISGTIRL